MLLVVSNSNIFLDDIQTVIQSDFPENELGLARHFQYLNEAISYQKKLSIDLENSLIVWHTDCIESSELSFRTFFKKEHLSLIVVSKNKSLAYDVFLMGGRDFFQQSEIYTTRFTECINTLLQKKTRKKDNLINNKIAIPIADGIQYINTSDICYFKASGAYSEIHLKCGQKIVISKKLGDLKNVIQLPNFIRPHRSYIVNSEYIKLYSKKDGGYIELVDKTVIGVNKENKKIFQVHL